MGAFIILHDGVTATEEEVKDFCRGKIARHKIPKYIFFVDTFPMTGSGKIQKFKLKDLGLKLLHLFLAMYFDGGKSCLHRNHSHVLVYVYSGEMVIDEKGQITRLHKGECAFIRKDFSVQMTKQAWNGEQFKAIFLMFTMKFLRDFYSKLDRNTLPKDAKRDQISLYKLPSNRPDIVSLFESMTPYFNSKIQPTEQLLQLKMVEGVYVLLNTDKNLYASIFDFTDPWKIDILEFMERNYMNDISMEEIANYTGRSLSTL